MVSRRRVPLVGPTRRAAPACLQEGVHLSCRRGVYRPDQFELIT
jgi:hypothetical protein